MISLTQLIFFYPSIVGICFVYDYIKTFHPNCDGYINIIPHLLTVEGFA